MSWREDSQTSGNAATNQCYLLCPWTFAQGTGERLSEQKALPGQLRSSCIRPFLCHQFSSSRALTLGKEHTRTSLSTTNMIIYLSFSYLRNLVKRIWLSYSLPAPFLDSAERTGETTRTTTVVNNVVIANWISQGFFFFSNSASVWLRGHGSRSWPWKSPGLFFHG